MATSYAAGSTGDFRVGTVLGRSISILQQKFGKFMALAFIMWLPNLLLLLSHASGGQQPAIQPVTSGGAAVPQVPAGSWALIGVIVIGWLFLFALCQPAIIYGAFQTMRGEEFGLGEAFGRALRRIAPVIVAVILASLLIGFGFLLLIIPGLIVVTMLYVTVPACVVERLGPVRSINRSAELTKGFRWKIFGLLFCLGLVGAASGVIQQILQRSLGIVVGGLGGAIVGSVTFAFQLIVYAVAYHDLRAAKEGIDIEQLAAVFD